MAGREAGQGTAAGLARLKAMGPGPWNGRTSTRTGDRIGDLGVYVGMVPVFQDWWFHHRDGGFDQVRPGLR